MSLCLSNVEPQSLQGVFSRDSSVNSYAQHTIIHISYCSGDVFGIDELIINSSYLTLFTNSYISCWVGGNVTQSYNDNNGQPIVQKGIINAQSAVRLSMLIDRL